MTRPASTATWTPSIATEGPIEAGSYEWNFIGRLITDVERLEESARFMRDDYSPVGARGCRLCVYEDGVLQRSCRLHQEIARLEAERDRLLLDTAIDKRFR